MKITLFKKRFSILLISAVVVNLSGCSLPMNTSVDENPFEARISSWINNSEESQKKVDAGLTAYLPLQDPFMSMATRIYLINEAKHHLDLQYYIWEDDAIGQHLLSELLKAADRGVKIRLLIDDQNGTKLDETLIQLAQHPNFQIKLFNPYKYRNFRVIDYIFRFNHINHRMHNKLIVADGTVAVTGGRNISSEYFDASHDFQFADMDIFFGGETVHDANTSFLQYWNDDLSYSIQDLVKAQPDDQLKRIRKKYAESTDFQKIDSESRIIQAQDQIRENLKNRPVKWAKAHFIADSPDKVRRTVEDHELLFNQIMNIMGRPKNHMEFVSAYFVPTQAGEDYLVGLAQQDIKVRVLTNSFLANDVPLVHAFYQKYRKPLLENGVQLYEFKPYIERDRRTWYEVMTGNVIPAKGKNTSRLHAKYFDIDGMVFIGSFNFDPRSAHLNTEVGLVVESDALQNEISDSLDQYLPQMAYQLKLNEKNEIIWLDHKKDGSIKEYTVDPETTKFQRFIMYTVSYLPIEWMM